MGNTIKVDRFLNSRVLPTSIFIVSGLGKTYSDYKNASKEYKDKFLIKDSVILSGAALGILANYGIGHKIAKTKPYQNFVSSWTNKINATNINKNIKTSIQYTKNIVKEISLGFMDATTGILGALGTDYILSKTDFEQPKMPKNIEEKETKLSAFEDRIEERLQKYADEDTVDIFYSSMTELPRLKFLSTGMIGVDALEIAQNKKFEDKLKHTTGYLVNDTLVPLLFLAIGNAFSQNIRPRFRIPIAFGTLFAGTLLTHKIFDKYTEDKTKKS